MVIDPDEQALSFMTGPEGFLGCEANNVFKYSDICVGPNNKLYCSPFGAPTILVIDTEERKFSCIGTIIPGDSQLSSICAGPNNQLFCSPEKANYVLVVKPNENKIEFITGNRLEKDKQMFLGICAGPDQRMLYCCPFNCESVLEINPRSVVEVAEDCGGKVLLEAFLKAEEGRQPNVPTAPDSM